MIAPYRTEYKRWQAEIARRAQPRTPWWRALFSLFGA
jgi:hypothetical protein